MLLHELLLAVGFGLITGSIVALAAVGVTLQFGVTNYVNVATGSYLSVAAFVAWFVNVVMGLNIWLAVAVSAVVMGGFALAGGQVLLRPFVRRHSPPMYMLIVTFGLWLMLDSALVVVWGPDAKQFKVGHDAPRNLGPFLLTSSQILIIVVAIATLVGVHFLLRRTKLGKAMRAMSDNASLAGVTGIDGDLVVSVTWVLTGVLLGLAGCVLALNLSTFQPAFGSEFLFVIFSAVILGGIGQPYGTMLGAFVIGLATELSAVVINSAYKADVAFLILIVMLLLRPQGLIPARGRV